MGFFFVKSGRKWVTGNGMANLMVVSEGNSLLADF